MYTLVHLDSEIRVIKIKHVASHIDMEIQERALHDGSTKTLEGLVLTIDDAHMLAKTLLAYVNSQRGD